MARDPELSAAGTSVPASIFARLRERLAQANIAGDEVIPLQIGDTYLAPAARLDEVTWAELAPGDLYAYGSPAGWAPLVEAIAAKVAARNGIEVGAAGVQVACGATHALAGAVQAVCDPGDELVLLAPHWPLIRGIAVGHGARPVEIDHGAGEPAGALAARLEAAITPRTAALYLATPNNPDGAMLSAAHLEAIAGVADRHGLWILADEVYEDYGYDAAHVSIASLAAASARTITVFSFAKSYAQAGLRVGYAVAAAPVAATVRKLVNHSVYTVPVAMQRAALGALTGGAAFLAAARRVPRGARSARARLAAPAACPAGGAYLWVDLRAWTGADCMPILEDCAAAGVLLAPGSAFGDAWGGFARLCFTGVPPARVDEGIDRINAVLARRT